MCQFLFKADFPQMLRPRGRYGRNGAVVQPLDLEARLQSAGVLADCRTFALLHDLCLQHVLQPDFHHSQIAPATRPIAITGPRCLNISFRNSIHRVAVMLGLTCCFGKCFSLQHLLSRPSSYFYVLKQRVSLCSLCHIRPKYPGVFQCQSFYISGRPAISFPCPSP